MRRLGVLGGTFDPIHEGHMALARAAIEAGYAQDAVLLPMARPAHRDAAADADHRLAMCRLAAAGEKHILVSRAGMGPGVRYTVDTLAPLAREFPDAQFFYIIGADKLSALPRWYGADRLFAQCRFLCFPREGADGEAAAEKARAAGAKVDWLPVSVPPYSASQIRAALGRYEDAAGLNRQVLCYQAENGLYQPDFLPKLKTMMNPRRFRHTLGVRKEAVRLADLHGAPIEKAALAAVLHDCAKGMPVRQMSEIASKQRLVTDESMLSSGAMLHGPVGAYLAQTQFGVRDEDVLNAIRNHTVGRPGMTKLELCIFVADATEENREDYKGLRELRFLAGRSLAAAAVYSIRLTKAYVEESGKPFYPIVNAALRDLEERLTNEEKKLLTNL